MTDKKAWALELEQLAKPLFEDGSIEVLPVGSDESLMSGDTYGFVLRIRGQGGASLISIRMGYGESYIIMKAAIHALKGI